MPVDPAKIRAAILPQQPQKSKKKPGLSTGLSCRPWTPLMRRPSQGEKGGPQMGAERASPNKSTIKRTECQARRTQKIRRGQGRAYGAPGLSLDGSRTMERRRVWPPKKSWPELPRKQAAEAAENQRGRSLLRGRELPRPEASRSPRSPSGADRGGGEVREKATTANSSKTHPLHRSGGGCPPRLWPFEAKARFLVGPSPKKAQPTGGAHATRGTRPPPRTVPTQQQRFSP